MTSMTKITVVVVDDDPEMVSMLSDVLGEAGYRVVTTGSGSEALKAVQREHPDLLISDLRMVGMTGHQLQHELKKIAPGLTVIVITGFGSIRTAVESMRLGAFDYITKPFSNDELLMVVDRAVRDRELKSEVRRLREEIAQRSGLENIIATSPKMLEQIDFLKQVANTQVSVLITGESGVGKDLFARALHYYSPRHSGPFVAVNCAAIPENLIESELFGHVRGAFTDARQDKTGLFQAANRGTLFLDEIGELPAALQAKLLRVLEDRRVRPIGATAEVTVDVRIVSATNANLEKLVAQSRFRADLYYRIATMTIPIPPLRERVEDIPLLAGHFLARSSAEVGKPTPKLSDDAIERMKRYAWPGNIRELQNALQRAAILCRNGTITPSDLPPKVLGDNQQPSIRLDEITAQSLTLEQLEREYVRSVLVAVGGNKREAARVLGIDRKTLYRKLEGSAIESAEKREDDPDKSNR